MGNNIQGNLETLTASVMTTDQLLEHWQGHRSLTRKMIEAFPEDKFFSYSIGGMRPFSALIMEMISMASPGIIGAATGNWEEFNHEQSPATRQEVLNLWDEVTQQINNTWPQITLQRFQEEEAAFGQYPGTILSTILYFIDNEIHHRGQGYVYLRSLGIQPPPFWERG